MITYLFLVFFQSTILLGDEINAFSPLFSQEERNFHLRLHSQVSDELPRTGTSDDSVFNPLSRIIENSYPSSKSLELWLDLRDTAVSPMAALEHLINDLWDEFPPPPGKDCLIDNVLVSLPTFSNIEDQNEFVNTILNGIEEEYESEIKVWFVGPKELNDESGTDGLISTFRINMDGQIVQTPVGKLLHANDSKGANSNPIPALETVSNGEWILLDTSLEIDPTTGTEMIQELVNLVTNVNSMGDNISFGGGSSNEPRVQTGKGGIAIGCRTPSDVVEMGGYTQSLSFGAKSFTSTDSGILIHSSTDSGKQFSVGDQSYALVIPFDDSLWKAASLVLGGSS